MPLIRIENWPNGWQPANPNWTPTGSLLKLMTSVRSACVQAEVPGIKTEKIVTVTLGGRQAFLDNNKLIVIVEDLYDRPDRTKAVRDRLARALVEAARSNLRDWKVEVIIRRFNPEEDGYASYEPQGSKQEVPNEG